LETQIQENRQYALKAKCNSVEIEPNQTDTVRGKKICIVLAKSEQSWLRYRRKHKLPF